MPSPFRPKKRGWFVAFVVATGLALLAYAGWAWWTPWRAGRAGGLTFGTIATAIFLVDALYPFRRRLLGWPFRTAQRWLQFHIYGGCLATVCVVIHVGFALPHGAMGWWLLGLTLWATATGFMGVMLQKWIPTVLAGTLRVEALASRIPELTTRLAGRADEIMSGGPDRLRAAYQAEIRPWLERPEPAWAYMSNTQAGRLRYYKSLDALDRFAGDPQRVKDLRVIVTEKAELDAHLSLQRVLRAWLLLHVPAALLLLGLLVVHIFAVLYL